MSRKKKAVRSKLGRGIISEPWYAAAMYSRSAEIRNRRKKAAPGSANTESRKEQG